MTVYRLKKGIIVALTAALCASVVTAGCGILPADVDITLPSIEGPSGDASQGNGTENNKNESNSSENSTANSSSENNSTNNTDNPENPGTSDPEAPDESSAPEETHEAETWPVDEGFTRVNQIVQPNVNVKLRKGPGTEYESAGLLIAQTKVERYSDNGSWSQIVYEGKTYYVASEFLSVVQEGVEITKPDSGNSSGTDTKPGESESSSEQPESSKQPESSSQQTPVNPSGQGGSALPADGSAIYSQYVGLDNTTVPFGFGSANRDALNRPTGVLYYENLYGQYKADFIGPETSNTVYLTMDEGYEAGFTPKILDVLKEKNVKAVFFITKQFVTEHPELVQRMVDEGHVIGNHSCKHPSDGMPSLGLQAEYEDIAWMHNYVLENFGYNMTLFRFPTGAFSQQSLALLDGMGYTSVFWSFAYRDWVTTDQPEPNEALATCLNSLHPGEIFLLHAVSETNTNNMAAFIDGVRAAGYEFGVYPANGF